MKKLKTLFLTFLLMVAGCTVKQNTESSESLMTIQIYDAGKADAMLFSTAEGYVLMDTGLEANADDLVAQLKKDGVTSLYAVILTHFDKDHAGGFAAVADSFEITHVYTTYDLGTGVDISETLNKTGLEAQLVSSAGSSFTLGETQFLIEGAHGSYSENEDNNSSLVTTVTCGSQTYLFMGDAQKYRIEEYLNRHGSSVNFLKMPYHGHSMNILKRLLAVTSPSDAVICSSIAEPDTEEAAETADLLNQDNITAWYTYNGDITVSCYADSYTITQ